MEREAENVDNNDGSVPWSGLEGSHVLESLADSFYEDSASDAGSPLDPQLGHIPKSPHGLQSHDWESTAESRPEISGSEEEASYQEVDEIYQSESGEFIEESPHIQTSPISLSSHPQHPDFEAQAGQTSQPNSQSSPSSLSCAADMTLALTLITEQPLGTSKRWDQGTGNTRVESSEEGGSEAPPASLFFGISDAGAEQAEKWNSESDTDLCRLDRQRARHTRISHNKSNAEQQVKENKSKCKRIAQLLTDAPNPQNKGALLFRKRRQRVKKYTLVSYGTGDNKLDSEDQIEEEIKELRSTGYNCEATSESELEEECSGYRQQHNLSLDWKRVQEMEALPETKGKGVLMFAQRRKRMDEITSQHEELRSKGTPVETFTEHECREAQNIYETKEKYERANYMDATLKQDIGYQDNVQQMNQQSYVPRPLVPNRTAKPFLGFQDSISPPIMPGSAAPVTKKHELRFKVPVPINTNPQVWSPTGDIIASRDERISVPAIKTGIRPETKRKINKQPAMQAKDFHPQYKEGRKPYVESEEDCFSLGAEASNFMQPRTIKLKNPPPVAPKPTINPACPPWLRKSPSSELFVSPRSPDLQPRHSPAEPHSQHNLQQRDLAQPQQKANHWNQTQATLQTPASAWTPVNSSSQLPVQPTTNSWSQQPPRSAVSIHAHSPTYSPHHPPSPARSKPDSAPHSVASCPPTAGKAYVHASKASHASPKGQVSDRGNRQGEVPTMVGKGAELFAKRQSRVEKFVSDAAKVQANKTRSPSPTVSLPNYWRYSSNVRAPPPLSYNPLLAPFYPPSATKQPPSRSPKIKPMTKGTINTSVKHLNTLDIMKHQPYHLDSSLFKYDEVPESKSPTPKPTPASKFEATKRLKHRFAPSNSTYNTAECEVKGKAEVPVKSPVLVSSQNTSSCQNTRSPEKLAADKHLNEKHSVTPAAHHTTNQQAPSSQPKDTSSWQSSAGDNIASAFSPASLIARGARQMAPLPKFSAKQKVVTRPHWRPVAMLR